MQEPGRDYKEHPLWNKKKKKSNLSLGAMDFSGYIYFGVILEAKASETHVYLVAISVLETPNEMLQASN